MESRASVQLRVGEGGVGGSGREGITSCQGEEVQTQLLVGK